MLQRMASNNEVSSAVENHPTLQLDMEDSEKGTNLEDEEKEDSVEARDSTSGRKDSTAKSVKRGHLRVGEDGQTMYKRTPTSAIMAAIQLGIGYSVGRLAAKPERDVLMVDFSFVEKVWFPSTGSRETPSHKFSDFRFKSYAPVAFRYFRDLFGIQPSDFLMSLSHEEVREVGNPGASGSLFFLSKDDMFIVKTVQHKEAVFLQQLLPGYYMNLHQNPRTLLPKFFGLYCYQSGSNNIRLTVMNNLLPSRFKYHLKYDLKGSTFKRRASKAELSKKSPTRKDLDFLSDHPEGILLEAETYDVVIKTIMRDCRVLESFKIMDYSLLLGIHNLDQAAKDKALNSPYPSAEVLNDNPERVARRDEFSAALEAIQIDREGDRPVGGVPAKNAKGERLILFIGIIDILQSYRLQKKLEHGWKSFLHDGDTVSVHKPSFYAKRFLEFMGNKVFKRMPTVTRGPSKRRTGMRQGGTPYRGKTSTVEAPVMRLGVDMVPPPYELPEPAAAAVEASMVSSEPDTPKLDLSTLTKAVKFNVDESAEETGEDSITAEPTAIAESESSSGMSASGGKDGSSSEVETSPGTITITKTFYGNPGETDDTEDPKTLKAEEETTNELKEVSHNNVNEVKESAEPSVPTVKDSFGSYEVTIVREKHSAGSGDEGHATTSTHTESGLKPEVQMKPSGSSEFVIIENAVQKPGYGEDHVTSSQRGMNDSLSDSVTPEEPESSTSKL